MSLKKDSISFDALESYAIKPFSGYVFTSTGFSTKDVAQISDTVEDLGGSYGSNMTKDTTHLVVKDINVESEKLKAARKWKITIVDQDWLKSKNTHPISQNSPPKQEVQYLENCSIFLGKGFDDKLSNYLRKIIRLLFLI